MSQYFWSHAVPRSVTRNKVWDAALMAKLEKHLSQVEIPDLLIAIDNQYVE